MILIAAGLFETLFAFCLAKARTVPASESLYWYGGFLLSLIISMWLLIVATRSLPIGTAYAVWTGIGAFGTVVMGILFQRTRHILANVVSIYPCGFYRWFKICVKLKQ